MSTSQITRRPLLILVAMVSALGLIVLSQQVMADMFGWLKKYDVHLSPEVLGSITLNGKPVAGAVIHRSMDYDSEYTDSVQTMPDGTFALPERNIFSRLPGNKLDQTTIRLVISAEYENKKYLLWYSTTPSIEPHRTFIEKLASLNCDLSNSEETHELPNYEFPNFPHGIYSICRWR